ncbi:DUF1127 domain-containing protein [Phaeobacter gallaeciensis]|uniref:DUF1127 domain-containing protein n=1 Tax=Phaeobacter gallaeciensis TaxID=60890 RepID=UPI00237EF2A0|nr:DUF1127 domain-containing protein [Phaeobacter gallaeciensis]MDE4303202.1 DUF1127 domain-containing protein [Phaeobacter gallaeciensis]MDE4307594.1 DUF1127 domain-containing protein [Phaeobacter gallaeciensis]MDE4312052.1 DUF1127 domain-containing protein [Phaeobacter gallaeciensis]MDE4316443.1 DUF1127 domain-containing protein [Phaeobacter gallaeciensis]MDE4320986.1 DUF1127 domain-containing protein [Phaeobacter gallaeciensis]
MTYISTTSVSPKPRRSLAGRIKGAFALTRQRRALAKLDAEALADIGISRDAAKEEARRPFWDAPDSWTR